VLNSVMVVKGKDTHCDICWRRYRTLSFSSVRRVQICKYCLIEKCTVRTVYYEWQ